MLTFHIIDIILTKQGKNIPQTSMTVTAIPRNVDGLCSVRPTAQIV